MKSQTFTKRIFKVILLVLVILVPIVFVFKIYEHQHKVIKEIQVYNKKNPFDIVVNKDCLGRHITLPDDNLYLLIMFADWCPQCKTEIQTIKQISQDTSLPVYGAIVSNRDAEYISKNFDEFRFMKNIGHLCANEKSLSHPVPTIYLVNPKDKTIRKISMDKEIQIINDQLLGIKEKFLAKNEQS